MSENTAEQQQPSFPEHLKDPVLGLNLHLTEINYILSKLGEQPHAEVRGLIDKIKLQGEIGLRALAEAHNASLQEEAAVAEAAE
jgi:hypothetical protein